MIIVLSIFYNLALKVFSNAFLILLDFDNKYIKIIYMQRKKQDQIL